MVFVVFVVIQSSLGMEMMVEPSVELQGVSQGKSGAQSISHTGMNLGTISSHRH